MQPGVVPGSVFEFHAARANRGIAPGVNNPLTTQAFDTSGAGNHGVLNGYAGTVVSGYAGLGTLDDPQRLVFDGSNDCISLPDLGLSESGKSCTFEAWAVPGAAGEVYRALVGESSSPSNHCELGYMHTTNTPCFTTFDGATFSRASGASALTDGLPHHIVGVLTPAGQTLYVDLVATTSAAPGTLTSTSTSIGQNVNIAHWHNGLMLLIRLYPFALTAAQVAQNRAAGFLWPLASDLTPETNFAVFDGNSLSCGDQGDVVHGVNDYPTRCAASLPGRWTHRSPQINGDNSTHLIAVAPTWHDVYARTDYASRTCIFFDGINSMSKRHGFGSDIDHTPAEEMALWTTYCNARRAAGFEHIVVCTVPAGNDPTRNTEAIADGYASWDAKRQAFNALLRAGYTAFADALADVGADPILGNVANCGDGVYFADQLHLTPAGYAILAGIVVTQIERLLDPVGAALFDRLGTPGRERRGGYRHAGCSGLGDDPDHRRAHVHRQLRQRPREPRGWRR